MSRTKANGAVSEATARIFIKAAHDKFHDEGSVEVDTENDNPLDQVSAFGETVAGLKEAGGLYVKAWVWVPLDELSEDDRCKVLGGAGK